jgi:hypothetical protein
MDELHNNVSEWLKIDNEIKKCNEKVKELRTKKNNIEDTIIDYASENKIDNLAIKTNEGLLKLTENKTASPLTFKYIEQCLKDLIENMEQIETIMTHLKEKRTFSYSTNIKKLDKN